MKSTSSDSTTPEQLIKHAQKARERAYCPYSHYNVGAAVLTESGHIILGCNVENAAYGETICAERVALTAAVASGHAGFTAIAVATRDGGSPCGACRQVMSELGPAMAVYLADENGEYRTTTVQDLLPDSFTPASLDR